MTIHEADLPHLRSQIQRSHQFNRGLFVKTGRILVSTRVKCVYTDSVEDGVTIMKEPLAAEILKLSPAERIQLAEDLWDSVAAQPELLPPLSDDQRKEIERRLAEHARDPSTAFTWEEVRARLWSRLG